MQSNLLNEYPTENVQFFVCFALFLFCSSILRAKIQKS